MKFSCSLTVLAALLFCSLSSFAEAASPQRPNIVFVLADDMNRDMWGAYGSVDCKTPHIDRIAREGVRFDRAYCAVAMCAPFRQELYSGRSPWRTGTLPNHSKSKPETKSIVHYLKPLGYRVALIGKSHVGPKASYPFEMFPAHDKNKDQNPTYLTHARTFMDACAEDGKPFCMFIASNDSHAPFTTGDPSVYDARKLTIPPYWVDTPRIREELVKVYAEVSNFDALVGSIRAELESRGVWRNTLFVVCSEQGTQLPFAKWTCYDNGLHTGLVAHWEGVTKAGSVAEELVSMADVTPTFVEAAGGSLDAGACDGKSFLKMLRGEQVVNHRTVLGAFTNCNIIGSRERVYPIRVIRNKNFSLIYNPQHEAVTSNVTLDRALAMTTGRAGATGQEEDVASSWVALAKADPAAGALVRKLHHRAEYELYHLKSDPYELVNAIDHPEYAEVVARLKEQLHLRLDALGDGDPVATERGLIATQRKKK